ncbi:SDR family NAD(P)-dependent oxidoreductase [Bordetella sp. BOR01]|uniref:SDR family NAD(P)-dependent oxidoreductase n=1 Tax=Bordetella sp. BOR01 TaxID=2854779 RepID=UPI001C4567E8|nr:SDR family NAD(P)-dependent oxidoreductase [Bordetella sp. BOR01]MBV7484795.1 SDR family oxidoreductase [Bordetella sp. BOR01]
MSDTQIPTASLAGRRILVVGAGRAPGAREPASNGNASCLALARAGARVACADRDRDAAQRTVDDIVQAGGRATALQADVADVAQIPGLLEQAAADLQGLDGLVLNVGISHRAPLAALSAESWDEVLNVNTRAHLFCAKHALPLMAPGGSIVFVSSTAARRPGGRNPAYEASKAALSAVCRAVALAGQPASIRANVVMLGLIDTPMGRAATQARPDRLTQPMPFGRQGTPEEVAAAIRFLLSEEASYINAIELPVDGGMSAGIVLRK